MSAANITDPKRLDKIANMQRLVDDARRSGVSDLTMADIRTAALKANAASRRQ